jgi:acetylornithine/succinyldiaminopimelate/putrescine aminotransferase
MTQRQLFLEHVAQTSETPLCFEVSKAEGVYLMNENGKKHIDLIGGISVCNVGHGNEKIKMLEQAKSAGDSTATVQAMKDSIEAKKDRDAAALELDKAIKAYELSSKNLAGATASIQKMSKAAADAKDSAEKDAKSAANSAAKPTME